MAPGWTKVPIIVVSAEMPKVRRCARLTPVRRLRHQALGMDDCWRASSGAARRLLTRTRSHWSSPRRSRSISPTSASSLRTRSSPHPNRVAFSRCSFAQRSPGLQQRLLSEVWVRLQRRDQLPAGLHRHLRRKLELVPPAPPLHTELAWIPIHRRLKQADSTRVARAGGLQRKLAISWRVFKEVSSRVPGSETNERRSRSPAATDDANDAQPDELRRSASHCHRGLAHRRVILAVAYAVQA